MYTTEDAETFITSDQLKAYTTGEDADQGPSNTDKDLAEEGMKWDKPKVEKVQKKPKEAKGKAKEKAKAAELDSSQPKGIPPGEHFPTEYQGFAEGM